MKTIHLLLLVLAFLLAGCATQQPDTSLIEPEPTMAKAVPTVAIAATAQAPTATPLPTVVVPATSAPDILQQVRASILPLVAPCNFADQAISYSPNTTWAVVTCLGDDAANGTTTKLVRLDGSQRWDLSFSETYLKPYRANDPNLSALLQDAFIPVRWTKNEDFVYLAVQTSKESTAYKGYDGLFRLDLSTGKARPVLKPAAAPLTTTYAFKFSPTGTKLAYINQAVRPISIVIVDTSGGGENRITLDNRFSQGGGLLWSSDEHRLIVSVMDTGKNGGNSIISYDLETMKNEYAIQNSANTYLPLEWVDTNVIYAESYPEKWVYLDLATGATEPAPAPIPAP